MAYSIDINGHLDLSGYWGKRNPKYDEILALAREYYFEKLCNLVAWDGTPIAGMNDEEQFKHLVLRHGHHIRGEDINPLIDLDINRIERLPLIKEAIEGQLSGAVYLEKNGDLVEIVLDKPDGKYIVTLASIQGAYRVRSAYPSDEIYVDKVKARCTKYHIFGTQKSPGYGAPRQATP